MRAPALLIAIPVLGGAAVGIQLVDAVGEQLPFLAAAAALIALLAAVFAALLHDLPVSVGAALLAAALAGLSLGVSAARDAYDPPLLRRYGRGTGPEPVVVEGVLREDAALSTSGISLTIEVAAVNDWRPGGALGGVRLAVGGALAPPHIAQWRAGRTIRAPAFLRLPSVYLNPGMADERRALARRGVVLVGTVKSGALVEVVRAGSRVSEAAAAIRAWTRARIAAHMAPPSRFAVRWTSDLSARSAGVTTAVLIGDRSGLSAEDERRLQEAGTYHVIAISGGNIAVLALLTMSAFRVILVPSRAAAVLAAICLLFYGVVAAGAASVMRAVAVAVLMLGARALDHRGATLNALAVAATLAVALSPIVVLDAGFILSFGATLGIVLGLPILFEREPRRVGRRPLAHQGAIAVAALCAATACAEIALAPVGAMLFSRVTFAGFLLNLAAIPLMTVVQVAGIQIAATSGWAPAAADVGGLIAHVAARALFESSALVDAAPWLALRVRPPVWWLVVSYYACVLALLAARVRKRAALGLAIVAVVMLMGPDTTARDAVPRAEVPLRVAILDVGQGDATVVGLPDKRTLLVDAGGLASFSATAAEEQTPAFDIGERVVVPALRALGVSRLDGLVITHGDPDHVAGARGVLRNVPASSMWEGVPVPPHAGLRSLLSLARGAGMTWRMVQAGDVERFGDVEVRVLHPPLPDWERQRVRNDDSIVLELRIGRVSIVLPGDIGKEGETAVLPKLEPGRLVVLKAAHHGSATSSTAAFLEALRPVAVVFSCGRDNRFGHPHPSVVARYRAMGSAIFSTAQDGAVFVETEGTKVVVWGWRGRRGSFGG